VQVGSVGARAGHKEALQSQLAITQIQVSFHSATAVFYMESPNTGISKSTRSTRALCCIRNVVVELELNQSFRTSPVFAEVRFTEETEKPVKWTIK